MTKTIELNTYFLSAKQFKKIFISGANNLFNNKNAIDALNVFPVPDGDTGGNMSSTAESASSVVKSDPNNENNIGLLTSQISKNMLLGARGNSGVILSQIFKGFALACENKEGLSWEEFKLAIKSAYERAYKSVLKPVEGTILTVIREVYEMVEKLEEKTLLDTFEEITKQARISCDNTPTKLKILREVGVTDSGAEGLYSIFEGMLSSLKGEDIQISNTSNEISTWINDSEVYDGEFGYCTEFIVDLTKPKKFNKDSFVNEVSKYANSLVVVNDDNLLKVHGHTIKPGNLLNFAQKYGEFVKIKSENMVLQANESRNKNNLLNENDNSKKSPEIEKTKKNCGIVSCNLGSGFISRMKEYGCDEIIESGQTQNPSAKDIITAIESVNAKNVFVLPNNSNIFLAAQQAAQVIKEKKVHIINTRSQIQGITAMMNFSEDNTVKENKEMIEEAIQMTKTLEITKAIRSTKIDGVKIKEGQYIAILDGKIILSNDDCIVATKNAIKEIVNDDIQLISIYYGNESSKVDANELANFIESQFDIEIDIVNGNQPNYNFIIGFE